MTPLLRRWLEVDAVSPLRAVDALARAGITVYGVQKCSPTRLKICIREKDFQKVFAILRGSCYTVKKAEDSRARKWLRRALLRPAFTAGLALFFVLAAASNFFVLRIDVVGSGARYRERAEQILAEAGIRAFAPYAADSADAARRAILDLPGVVFAAIEREGSCVTVTIEEEEEAPAPAYARALYAPASGEVEELVVLRGTPTVSVGDSVTVGQELVAGRFVTETGGGETFAVARCSLLCPFTYAYESAEQSGSAERRALAAAKQRAGGECVRAELSVAEQGGGYVYTVALVVRVRCAVNMGAA